VLILVIFLRYIVKRLSVPLVRLKPNLQETISGIVNNLRLMVFLTGLLTAFSLLGLAGYMTYRGLSLEEGWLWLMSRIPEGFWLNIGIGFAKSLFLWWILAKIFPKIDRGLERLQGKATEYEGLKSNTEAITAAFDLFQSMVKRGGWLAGLGVIAGWLLLPDKVGEGVFLMLRIYLIITFGLLFWRALDAIIESIDALSKKYASTHSLLKYYEGLSGLIPIFRRTIEYIIYVSVASMAVHQIEFIRSLAEWGPRLIKIIGVALIARVVIEVMRLVVEEYLITRPKLNPQQKKSRITLTPLAITLLTILIWFGAGVVMLREVGIDPFPILAGAGIVGIAVGLGAQNMMNDMVSGFVILLENYYLVGDWVRIGKAEGIVEAISISNTRIRDENGRLHIIRNGDVKDVVNFSKEFIHATVEVLVPYGTSFEMMKGMLEENGQRLCKEQEAILEPMAFEGIQAFQDFGMLLRTTTKVRPGFHLEMERYIRKEIVSAREKKGVSIPFNRHYVQSSSETSTESQRE